MAIGCIESADKILKRTGGMNDTMSPNPQGCLSISVIRDGFIRTDELIFMMLSKAMRSMWFPFRATNVSPSSVTSSTKSKIRDLNRKYPKMAIIVGTSRNGRNWKKPIFASFEKGIIVAAINTKNAKNPNHGTGKTRL